MLSLLRNMGGLWFAQLVRIALSVAISVAVIRYLGPDRYGILGVAGAYVTLFGALVGLPQPQLVIRELAGPTLDARAVLSTAFVMRMAGALIQVGICESIAFGINQSTEISAALMLLALMPLAAPLNLLSTTLEYDGRFNRIAGIDFASTVLGAGLRVLLILHGAHVVWFAAAAVADVVIQGCLSILLNDRRQQLVSFNAVSKGIAWTYLKEGWPLLLSVTAMAIYTRIDVLIIAHFLGEADVGHYTAAARTIETLYFFPCVISTICFPTLARRRQDDPDGYYRLITNSCGAAFWLGMAIAGGLCIAAPWLLPLLLGAKFESSVAVAQIAAWSIPAVALNVTFSGSMTIAKSTHVILYATICSAFVNVVTNLVLVPLIGIAGSAVAMMLAPAVNLFSTFIFFRDERLLAALLKSVSPGFVLERCYSMSVLLRARFGLS